MVRDMETTMNPKDPNEPTRKRPPTRGPLTDLVDDELNKPLADQIADKLDDEGDEPARSGATDYARGTAEHDDDQET
jgi:hypothetical protein